MGSGRPFFVGSGENAPRPSAPARLRAAALYALMPGLSAANAAVGLLLPALLGPTEFGRYAIAVTLFQYALIADLGVSQLIDRRVPPRLAASDHAGFARFTNAMLWLRLYIAAVLAIGGSLLLLLLGSVARAAV